MGQALVNGQNKFAQEKTKYNMHFFLLELCDKDFTKGKVIYVRKNCNAFQAKIQPT